MIAFTSPLAEAEEAFAVFDIDWTLVNPVGNDSQKPDFIHDGKKMRLLPYVGESFYRLIDSGYSIVLMSGGSRARNEELAKEIFDEVQRIAREQGRDPRKFAPRWILSLEDLDGNPEATSNDPFRKRFKKNLLKQYQRSGASLLMSESRVLALDDIPEFARADQSHLFLVLKNTYNNYDSFEEARAVDRTKEDLQFVPATKKLWALDRGRVAWATEVMIQAKIAAEKSGRAFWEEAAELVVDRELVSAEKIGVEKLSLNQYQESRTSNRQIALWRAGVAKAKAVSGTHRCVDVFSAP